MWTLKKILTEFADILSQVHFNIGYCCILIHDSYQAIEHFTKARIHLPFSRKLWN